MVIYKDSQSIELEYNDGKNDSIIVDYDENIVYQDILMLEFMLNKEKRNFEFYLHHMQPGIMGTPNLSDSYVLRMNLSPECSEKYFERIFSNEAKNILIMKNLNRCDINLHFSNEYNYLFTDKDCNKITAEVGIKNPLYQNYLENRFIETLEFILFTHEV